MPWAADLPLCGSSSSALLQESPNILREAGTSKGEKAQAEFDPGSMRPATIYLSAPLSYRSDSVLFKTHQNMSLFEL